MLIFIAGVHGVGKGYLCSFAKEEFEVTHVSASELIKNNSELTFNSSKLTATPDKNQLILLTALKELTAKKQNILLDGHFALINKKGDVEALKTEIYEKMSLDGVILIEESDELIRERVMLRDKTQITYNLEKLIETERKNATCITEKIKVPLIILKSPTKDEFFIALKNLGMVKKHAHSKL